MKIQNPHDKFFKETMGNVETAKDFLMNYLPESVMRVVNLETLELQKDSFISLELEESFSDLLFQVDVSGKEGYLYFLSSRLQRLAPRVASVLSVNAKSAFTDKPSSACRG